MPPDTLNSTSKQSGSKQFGGRRTESAQVILNTEANTPSLVYFGEDETLAGRLVDELIEDVSDEEEAQR